MSDRPLLINDDRYSRFQLIAWWDQEKLARARILVVGAGALGNEVLKNLALLGVGHLVVVDFDQIETSNLTRSVLFRQRDCGRPKATVAVEALHDLNPEVRALGWEADVLNDVGIGLVREMDVVIGCLDNREARLWLNRLCWKAGRPWIDGGIQEINGVVKVFVPPESACYECGMTENDYRLINLRYSCPLLRHEDLQAGKVPTAPTISSIIAGLQTQEALKLIHGIPVDAGSILVFNGLTNQSYKTAIQHREECLSHEHFPDPMPTGMGHRTHCVGDLLQWAAEQVGPADWSLELDRDLVVSLACPPCETTVEVMRPWTKVGMRQARCDACGQWMQPHRVHRIGAADELASRRLADVGIPAWDVVRLGSSRGSCFALLDGDRSEFQTLGW